MLRTGKSIQISKHRITLHLSGIGHLQVVGVSVHGAYLLLHLVCRVRQINTVTERLAHFSLAVSTRQAQASGIFRQQDIGLHKRIPVDIVETTDNLTRLFQHRLLVLSHRHGRRFESRNVGSLTDRISEEPHRNARLEVTHLYFCLHCRITLQARHGHQIHEIERQLAQLRYLRLDEDGGLGRIDAAGQIIECHFYHVLPYLFRIVYIIRQGLGICFKDEYFIELTGILQLHSSS